MQSRIITLALLFLVLGGCLRASYKGHFSKDGSVQNEDGANVDFLSHGEGAVADFVGSNDFSSSDMLQISDGDIFDILQTTDGSISDFTQALDNPVLDVSQIQDIQSADFIQSQDISIVDFALSQDSSSSEIPQADLSVSIPGIWVAIPAGTFTMGSPTSEPCRLGIGAETQHQVTLTHAFVISAYETTQGDFQTIMGYNPSYLTLCGSSCPVETVTWYEVAAYANALSTLAGLSQCYSCTGTPPSVTCSEATAYSGANIYNCPGFRLPTEAEWEYAYRAQTTTAFYNGSISSCYNADTNADQIGWYYYNSSSITKPVGLKQPNAWGLYDIAGNLWEWTNDGFITNLGSSAITNPWTPLQASGYICRGGSRDCNPWFLRAASRASMFPPSSKLQHLGFRCVRSL